MCASYVLLHLPPTRQQFWALRTLQTITVWIHFGQCSNKRIDLLKWGVSYYILYINLIIVINNNKDLTLISFDPCLAPLGLPLLGLGSSSSSDSSSDWLLQKIKSTPWIQKNCSSGLQSKYGQNDKFLISSNSMISQNEPCLSHGVSVILTTSSFSVSLKIWKYQSKLDLSNAHLVIPALSDTLTLKVHL